MRSMKATWKDGKPAKLVRWVCDCCGWIIKEEVISYSEYVNIQNNDLTYCICDKCKNS